MELVINVQFNSVYAIICDPWENRDKGDSTLTISILTQKNLDLACLKHVQEHTAFLNSLVWLDTLRTRKSVLTLTLQSNKCDLTRENIH